MAITLRTATQSGATTKGSPLTHAELDANFTSLMGSGGASYLGFLQAGGTARTVQSKLRDSISVKDYGAVGDGSTDDTAAIQAALAAAQTAKQSVYIPAGIYLVSGTITISGAVRLFGDGWGSIIRVGSSVGATTDIIKLSSSSDMTNVILEDFAIIAQSGTPGRHAISVDITAHAVSYCRFSGLFLGALGGKGFVTLPNASPITDGFFTSVIEDCEILNGIYLDKAGDSIRILNNTITGANASLYADLVFVSASNKAHGLTFADNNCTSTGGGVLVKSAYGAVIGPNNIFENTAGTANNALVDLDGTDATNFPQGIKIISNTFNTPSSVDAVRTNFTRRAQIAHNNINEPGGGGFSLKVTANSTDTQYLFNDTNLDSTIASQISDAGTRTLGVRQGLAGYLEIYGDHNQVKQGANVRMVDTAGTSIRVLRFESADNTVKVGAMDAPASNGDLLFYANGAIAGRFAAAGPFRVQGDGSNTTPAFSFNNETNTGFHRVGTAQLGVSVNGTQRYEFGSSTNGFTVHQTHPISWGASGVTGQDTYLYRDAANTIAQKNSNADQINRQYGMNAGYWERGSASELLTIAAAATTDSTANLLPANSIIEAVTVRVTTLIPTAATFTVGDATIAGRFATGVAVAATTTAVGLTHIDQTGTSGPRQTAAAKVRITPNLTPATATGVVRITVFYRSFVAPTS